MSGEAAMAAVTHVRGTGADLRALFAAHFDFVWRSVRRLGVEEAAADDAAQEVFIVASRRLADIERGKERAFLFGTAVRVASSFRRARARRGVLVDGEQIARVEDGGRGADEVAERKRAREMLDRVLDEMDDDLRTVLVLHELEEMTMIDIASLLDVPQGTVASRLRRAREDFRARVGRVRARGGGA